MAIFAIPMRFPYGRAIWHGPLTGVVNNAAGNFISRTEDLSVGGFNAISDIVFRGSFYVTLDIGKRLISEGRRASFLSILTTWVWNGGPFVVPSAMSKAGLNVMTQSLAVEWGRYGLRFNAIAPGLFPTDGMSARLSPGGRGGNSHEETNPMGRHGEMHELANLAVFLMGPGAEWINGQTIAIDGGGYQAHGGNFYGALKDGRRAMGSNARDDQRHQRRGTRPTERNRVANPLPRLDFAMHATSTALSGRASRRAEGGSQARPRNEGKWCCWED